MASQNNCYIFCLPDEILEMIIGYASYEQISNLRSVCRKFDVVCQHLLNQGFVKVDMYHAQCYKTLKARLPRRESERRNHPMARHADILSAIETRLSLLGMTFMKYVDMNLCCFIPGKVVDEIYRVLWFINSTPSPPRAHELLQELRDISSMAMEYFDDKIAPTLKSKIPMEVSVRMTPNIPVASTSGLDQYSQVARLAQQVQGLKKDLASSRTAMQEQRQKAVQQEKLVSTQKQQLAALQKVAALQRKTLNKQRKKTSQLEEVVAKQEQQLSQQERQMAEQQRKIAALDSRMDDISNQLAKGPLHSAVNADMHPQTSSSRVGGTQHRRTNTVTSKMDKNKTPINTSTAGRELRKRRLSTSEQPRPATAAFPAPMGLGKKKKRKMERE
ncbi:PREDICTED: F-box only protein 28-like [Branchiostoma belcheri]|uniref:F-box only protein 28-like n=1 Tax=Branchiostoma belcheri TaxID=7741 RepID=A0A6P4YNG6_BRABE|nr:PREDICTED: F-box only protein 28-like [Branchiostoma belcheri]